MYRAGYGGWNSGDVQASRDNVSKDFRMIDFGSPDVDVWYGVSLNDPTLDLR